MCRFLSKCRPVIHAALAALVVTALSHCSWEESRELAQTLRMMAIQAAGHTIPIEAPIHDCDRESGCICRGATQTHAIVANDCKPLCTDILPADLAPAAHSWLIDTTETPPGALDDDCSLPPISGRQLRALYASLLI